jgi:hypothetical protein
MITPHVMDLDHSLGNGHHTDGHHHSVDDGSAHYGDVSYHPDNTQDIMQVLPFKAGSQAAKIWWKHVQDEANSSHMYHGKPLQKGPHSGDGDFDFMVDKLQVAQGYSHDVAVRIAAATKHRLYG